MGQSSLLFIVRRLFGRTDETTRVSRPAIRIATIGVAVGVAVMLISVAVARGFQQEVRNKVTGFGAHLQVLDYQSLSAMESAPIVVDDSLMQLLRQVPEVVHVQRYCVKPGMLKTETAFRGLQFRGVGPEYDTTFLHKHLVEGVIPQFSDTTSSNQMLISRELARQLGARVGDRIYAYFFDSSVRARRLTVAGIYCTNMVDFDRSCAFVDLDLTHTLLGWQDGQCSGCELTVNDFNRLSDIQMQVIDALGHRQDVFGAYYSVMNVQELYQQIFSWLSLLDMDVWVILILMVCVSGFTMISGLLIIILERTNFIGVMKAMGATNGMLQRLFLLFASQIIVRGMLWGNVVTFVLLFLQQKFGLLRLDPEVYYMDRVPVLFDFTFIALVNAGTFLISLLAMVMPSFLVAHIHPARSIRFE